MWSIQTECTIEPVIIPPHPGPTRQDLIDIWGPDIFERFHAAFVKAQKIMADARGETIVEVADGFEARQPMRFAYGRGKRPNNSNH